MLLLRSRDFPHIQTSLYWMVLALWGFSGFAPFQTAHAGDHYRIDKSISQRAETGWENASQIWEWAEPGYQEVQSSKLLADWLEQEGFRVQRGVAEIPTAFTAEFGDGGPVIAILGEYDALPGLSQNPVPYQEPDPDRTYGHGCGHHLFGVAGALAAMAVADEIRAGNVEGTIRFYGCPAEEGGSAKVFLVRAGLFDDVDIALHWHPSSLNGAGDRSTLARIAARFRFHGTAAHAAGAPEQGRSALDGVEMMNFGVQLMREHIPQDARIHYVITSGGEAPNVVPAFAEVYYYVRHPSSHVVQQLYDRVVKCARGAATATETEVEIAHEGGIVEILPNVVLSEVIRRHLHELNNLELREEDAPFALKLQETLKQPKSLETLSQVQNQSGEVGMGSTDVGDVSWVVPTAGFNVACWVPGTPGHSWQAVACGKSDLARQGMLLAARVLAHAAIEIMHSPDIRDAARKEFTRRTEKRPYQPLITPEQQPPLDYRNPTSK